MRKDSLIFASALCGLFIISCSTTRKVSQLRKAAPSVSLSISEKSGVASAVDTFVMPHQDTLTIVDMDGKQMMLMRTVTDENGETTAMQELQAAYVTANFRNVAERNGKVDLEYDIHVPRIMLEQSWQTRFYPRMYILKDTVELDKVIVTGQGYRNAQLKGYQRYNRFLASIVSDTSRFVNIGLLETFLQRNIPQVYAFKTDSTEVSEEDFKSCFGVSERQAIDHYTNKIARYFNNRRKSMIGAMYRKYVKAPIITEGVRLDTVIVNPDGDLIYTYVQTITTRPRLRKVDIAMSGQIFEQDLLQYSIPECNPITFYISSISTFADNTERYLTKVIERKLEANTTCHIEFEQGKWSINPKLSENAMELSRIKSYISDILNNEKYDLDSISVRSFCSPEGSVKANHILSDRRTEQACRYFRDYVSHVQDSLRREAGISINLTDYDKAVYSESYKKQDIRIHSISGGENWSLLDHLVSEDENLNGRFREYYSFAGKIRNLDERERVLQKAPEYKYIKKTLYPTLRNVEFNFFLHRKGMVKDTVHTTVLDTVYMNGVQALRDHDYKRACELLGPYGDYNTAVAYLADGRNESSMSILRHLKRTPRIDYMMAIIYSRKGDEQNAVQHFINACKDDSSYINRGNLDPEISSLIKKYNLSQVVNKEDYAN